MVVGDIGKEGCLVGKSWWVIIAAVVVLRGYVEVVVVGETGKGWSQGEV